MLLSNMLLRPLTTLATHLFQLSAVLHQSLLILDDLFDIFVHLFLVSVYLRFQVFDGFFGRVLLLHGFQLLLVFCYLSDVTFDLLGILLDLCCINFHFFLHLGLGKFLGTVFL